MTSTRQRRKKMTFVGLSTLLLTSSVLSVFFPLQGQVEAAPIKKEIVYAGNDKPKPLPDRGAVWTGKTPQATTETISEDAGSGKKIQKIVFYKGTEAVKTIDVNAQTYRGSETFVGEALEVNSIENGSAGSWFAWTRTILSGWTAGGEGETWTGQGDVPVGSEQITTQNSGETYNRTYKSAPGRKIKMIIQYPISNPFKAKINGVDVRVPIAQIDNRTNIVQTNNPQLPSNGAKVEPLYDKEVSNRSLGISGLGHPTTNIESILVGLNPRETPGATRDLTFATITFTQEHDDNTQRYYVEKNSDGSMRPYNKNPENAQITAFYYAAYQFVATSVTYQYPDHYWVYTEPGEPTEPPPTGGDYECSITDGRVIEGENMNPQASAVIKADQRDREIFDVLQGIPTSESLYGNVLANSYLHQYKFQEKVGTCTYNLTIRETYDLSWVEKTPNPNAPPATIDNPKTDTDYKTYDVSVVRNFSYWVVDKLGVYQIDSAELKNYAFQGESITIHPAGYTPPNVVLDRKAKYDEFKGPFNLDAGSKPVGGPSYTSRPPLPDNQGAMQAFAEAQIRQVNVNNDKLTFNGQTIMSDAVAVRKTQDPQRLPEPQIINRDVLYSPNHMIPMTKTNRMAAASMGTISYIGLDANYEAPDGDTYPIPNINPVTVHTPVVNYSSASDDAAHNQKTNPSYGRMAFILDRPFTITMPTSGQHQNYPGYGNRDYAKYFRSKEVYFPFDVYSGDKSQFYPKNTWINIPVSQITTTFFLPVWVDEGHYTVYYRNIAENAPGVSPTQQDANFDLANHVASDTVDVDVIGRLYDFHITDIADYNWEMVFRTQKGSAVHTGNTYWTGLHGIDGAARGNTSPFTLPILPGSNPLEGMKNIAVKTGYHIKFDLKTKGNMFGKTDGIRITPSFTFVSKDGKTQTPVDLYYNDDHRTFIKVGSLEDTEERYVILNDRLRNVPEEELTDTARYKYDNYYTFAEMNSVSRDMFISDYIRRFTKAKTPIGGFDLLLLPEQIRTLIGPKANLPGSVDLARANAAVQKWYGHYSLPGDPYVVAQGTNLAEYGRTHRGLTKRDPIFLRDGYIILNFNIESIRNGNLAAPHLQYINAPLMNQWALEGFKRSVQDSWKNTFTLQDGDIVFFNADKSYKDDFQVEVNH
ncbi:DUF5704 domain-containing protein [Saccharibacillus alkalitolerans]|uniref:DUF5704 domain-containing protein n=1 Tax=Saccharibacillus alkalitolerans TaxID=2705290 RepID=A0ABX0F7F6_9BACL|nr:DUF5704 domain-containing protein [Saccharibacillus alkalitolerans]NGZ76882.1 hypothetical protein [Saccharibacillus alkalitolerans]